jgi:hypothetical protein
MFKVFENVKTKLDTTTVSRKMINLEINKETVAIAEVVKEDVEKKCGQLKMYSVISGVKTKIKDKASIKKTNYKGLKKINNIEKVLTEEIGSGRYVKIEKSVKRYKYIFKVQIDKQRYVHIHIYDEGVDVTK